MPALQNSAFGVRKARGVTESLRGLPTIRQEEYKIHDAAEEKKKEGPGVTREFHEQKKIQLRQFFEGFLDPVSGVGEVLELTRQILVIRRQVKEPVTA